MRYFLFLILPLSLLLSCQDQEIIKSPSSLLAEIDRPASIAFGSCNHATDPQNYWTTISGFDPELWIWMGDNIYADTEDMGLMRKKYELQKNNSFYSQFISVIPVIGTWDDHDYGINDGDKTYPKKAESKTLLLDFLDVDQEAEVREHEGVYQSHYIGSEKRIKVILLDARYFRDVLQKDTMTEERYLPSSGDLLGDQQWNWLDNELTESQADLNIIVSGIQFLASDHPYEKWSNFPNSKHRMHELLNSNADKKVLFLSGDRHLAEISRLDSDSLRSYPLYDITSSGLTHSYEEADEYNALRIGDLVTTTNFGLLKFNWTDSLLSVRAQIISTDAEVLVEQELGSY